MESLRLASLMGSKADRGSPGVDRCLAPNRFRHFYALEQGPSGSWSDDLWPTGPGRSMASTRGGAA